MNYKIMVMLAGMAALASTDRHWANHYTFMPKRRYKKEKPQQSEEEKQFMLDKAQAKRDRKLALKGKK